MTAALARHGIVVRRATPPSDVVAPAAVMAEAVRESGLEPAQPIYLELTCVPDTLTPSPDFPPPDRCGWWDISLGAEETEGLWFVTFPGVSMGATEIPWGIFDAKTGRYRQGGWP